MKLSNLMYSTAVTVISAVALPAYAQVGALDDIIVTAQKRAENIQDVPQAVSAISASELQLKNINETSDLSGSLPNLQITSAYGKTQPNFSLRGISVANEFSAATASPIGIYVDEVYQSFRASHGQQLFDLEQVEVLRGPQGTLYGRNTTGGAINFFTRKPELSGNNGYINAGYGNYDTLEIGGAVEATLLEDQLGIRLAGTRSEGDGFTENIFDGKDYGSTDDIAGRASIRLNPASGPVDINAKIYAAKSTPRANLAYGIGYLAGETNAAGYSRSASLNNGQPLKENEIESDTAGTYETRTKGASLSVEYKASDKITLTSVTGFDQAEYDTAPFDCDGSPVNICAIEYHSDSDNFNQDFRLNYDDEDFKFIAGAYYGKDTVETDNRPDFFGFLRPLLLGVPIPGSFSNVPIGVGNSLGILPKFATEPYASDPTFTPASPGFCDPVPQPSGGFFDARSLAAFQYDVATTNTAGGTAAQTACQGAGAAPFAPILGEQHFDIQRPSYALYGEGVYDLTDRMAVTVGLRYTWDKIKFRNGSSFVYALDGTTPAANLVPYSASFNPSIGVVNQTEKTGRLTGRMILDYKFSDDILGYASYSRGYRAGTYNALAYQDASQVYFVKPEKVDAYEMGLKTRLADNRVQLNLAGFYYDYSNQQIAQIIGATSFLRNANGRLYGVEAELQASLADNFRVDVNLGYNNSKYTGNKVDDTDPRNLTLDINGNDFANAPKWTLSIGGDWEVVDKFTLRADAKYMGEYFFDPFGDYGQKPCDKPASGTLVLAATPEIACGNPGYWTLDARATYDVTDNMSVSLWGKNITDKFYYVYGLNLNAFYQDYFTRGQPRTYGVEANYRF